MEEKAERKVCIKIYDTGYHYEKPDEFETSYYRAVYKSAYLAVEDIIDHYSSGGDYRNRSKKRGNPANILTFVGRRGSGKTSVMRSFMDGLKEYGQESYYGNYSRRFHQFEDKVMFTCLDCIDGALLEHGEDVFKTVLAQMYQKFMDLEAKDELEKANDFDFRKRELLKDLEDVYRTVCNIETMEKGYMMSGEAYMNSLQSFSSSQKVRRGFIKLIDGFTEFINYKRDRGFGQIEKHYMVIAIDDIDLNIENGFTMLEKIYRYCTVPNVILLLTLDIQQILSIVLNHFYEIIPKIDSLLCEREDYVRKLSMDYLEKVLPINYRIYMPLMNLWYLPASIQLEKETEDVKHSILGKIYRRTGICFDSNGLKMHFYQPASMRQLTGFYLLLESLEKPELDCVFCKKRFTGEKAETDKYIFEENYNVLISDLKNRMAFEKLGRQSDLDFFREIIKEDIRRAKVDVVNYCRKIENSNAKILDEENVSYGKVIETIYKIGRLHNKEHKPMVHCLMAYFTYAFTRQYISCVYEVDNIFKEKGRKRRKEAEAKIQSMVDVFVGGGILDNWNRDIVPPVQVQNENSKGINESSLPFVDEDYKILISKNYLRLRDMFEIDIEELEKIEIEDTDKIIFYNEIAKIIRNMELLYLCFTNFSRNGDYKKEEVDYEFETGDTAWGKRTLAMKDSDISGYFNVLNIFINSVYASEKLAKLEIGLKESFQKIFQNKLGSDFEKILKEYSLKEEYLNWERRHGEVAMPLPLYWFDFTYNILKRTRNGLKKENPQYISSNQTYKYAQRVYIHIQDQLKKQKNFYITEQTKAYNNNQFLERFQECPGVKCFLDPSKGEEEFMNSVFEKIKNTR